MTADQALLEAPDDRDSISGTLTEDPQPLERGRVSSMLLKHVQSNLAIASDVSLITYLVNGDLHMAWDRRRTPEPTIAEHQTERLAFGRSGSAGPVRGLLVDLVAAFVSSRQNAAA